MKKRAFLGLVLALILTCLVGCTDEPKGDEKPTKAAEGPSTEEADLNRFYDLGANEVLILMNAIQSEEKGLVQSGRMYIPFSILSQMDDRFYWNEEENSFFFTNAEKRYRFKPGENSHLEGEQSVSDGAPMLITVGDQLYFCTDMIQKFGHIKVTVAESPNRVLLIESGRSILQAKVKADTAVMRTGRDESFSIISELPKGTPIFLAEDLSGEVWTKVVTEDGRVGYVSNLDTTMYDEVTVVSEVQEPAYEHHMLDKKVCMVWHNLGGKQGGNELKAAVRGTQSLNVISPTWFSMNDTEGGISSLASADYVKAAHNAGLKVWALCDDFDANVPCIEVFKNTEKRAVLIRNLVNAVTEVGADGINIDFEYITVKSAPHFLQFLRELYLACRGKNLTLSTDNYYPNDANAYYNLKHQSMFIDYIIFMGYDEYHAKSTVAGPVASVNFVKNGVSEMLKKVPASQLILGIPFFSRKWTETTEADGTKKQTSTDYGMDSARAYVKDNGGKYVLDEKTGLKKAEMRTPEGAVRIWLQDADSTKVSLGVMRDNQLAGCAAWKLGLESKDTWDVIKNFFTN